MIFRHRKNKQMKTLLSLLMTVSVTAHVNAAERFVSFQKDSDRQYLITNTKDTITYDAEEEWEGVKIAVRNLRMDFRNVTGRENAPVTVGTVGKSRCIGKYKKLCQQLKGKWEQFYIVVDEGGITILGSDKRGTIYGIYELSRQIGVSPWYWMADAPVAKHEDIYATKGTYTDGEPKVKYRGIFINDEWPSFGTWCNNRFGGINSKAYSRIFELLLRLKANYMWPAMWDSRFNEDDPLSPKVADEMGIVMGTSHHEPMMRAHKEYTTRKEEVGPWDYSVNPDRLNKFFTEGLARNRMYESIITIGMRGDGDVAMGRGDDVENMKTLKKVIETQRQIISDVYGRKATEIPQLWAIFTEVQRYYDAGFSVPDDVTLLLCDNNWGYIRRKARDFERRRKGGVGLYYHIDMNGGPWNDRWVNTTTIPKLREQLHLAYTSGIDRIWIINVGDLKPKEVPINFIMDYAWNPDAVKAGDEQEWLRQFAGSVFGREWAEDVADIIAKYSKYNLLRKPEVQYPGIFNMKEMMQMNAKWQTLVLRCERLKKQMPEELQDAFFQLVYYPAVASAGVAQIYNYASIGDSAAVSALMDKDRCLTTYYNKQLTKGKWDGMMLDNHIGYTQWSIPDANASPLALGQKPVNSLLPAETKEYSIPAYRYARKVAGKGAEWMLLPDLGRGEGCMGSSDVMADNSGAVLEYELSPCDGDSITIAIGILPTQDIFPRRGLRLGVQIDDREIKVLDARRGMVDIFGEYTKKNLAVSKELSPLPEPSKLLLSGFANGTRQPRRSDVFDNLRWLDVSFLVSKGTHTLKLVMIDPEIVVEQITVNPDNQNYSYFGGIR